MEKSLKVFEQEFYERLSKGEISLEKIGTVPEVYRSSGFWTASDLPRPEHAGAGSRLYPVHSL